MNYLKETILDEEGLSLIEILATMVILGIALLGFSSLMYQNFIVIDQNKLKEEAIFCREDIKEWLTYRAQNQDVANLNTFTLTTPKNGESSLTEEQWTRRKHLILDESGIQSDSKGDALYGEVSRDGNIDRGEIVSKVKYSLDGQLLPDSLLQEDEFNKYYIGEYLNQSVENPMLVKIQVIRKSSSSDYNPRTDGVRLNILIYSKESGTLLTETYLNWVAEY